MDPDGPSGVTLAELVAAMSLAVDLGMGLPTEHVLRQTLIALRLAESEDLSTDERSAVYYVSLLAWVGCAADSELGDWFGESAFFAGSYVVDMAGLPMAAFVTRQIGRGYPPLRRLALVGRFLATGGRALEEILHTHCLSAGDLAERLGFGGEVRDPLLQTFERWDGKGTPGAVREEALAPAIRVVHLADIAEVYHRAGGVDAALEMARRRRGTQFDPALVDRFCERAPQILARLDDIDWNHVIESEPGLGRELTGSELDAALQAFGDFADLKSRFTRGHSRGVTDLADRAGARVGLARDDCVLLRRAAMVHDLGAIGIATALWEKRGPLSAADGERMRTHPYLAERTLARSPALAPIGALAALHHERLDGSGYPRGLSGDAIGPAARVLAAADVYHALTEERPHRPAQTTAEAERTVRAEVLAGRLDGDAVNAVLAAAGHRVRRRAGLPGGLTPREVEVLVLLARGRSNPEIATQLVVSRKTVGSHIEHIYTKLGVSSRTEAALFAMRHGLLPELPAS